MFNLFRWSSTGATTQPSLSSRSIPIPPPMPGTPHLGVMCHNLDLMSTLSRIESKLDIILTKLDASGEKRKKFTILEPTATQVIKSETIHSETHPSGDFVSELMKKVEARKIAKNMGASHGFASLEEALK